MRLFYRSLLLLVIFSTLIGVSVHAEEVTNTQPQSITQQLDVSVNANDVSKPQTSSKLEIKALAPENFDKTILISLVTDDQKNVMCRLEKMNRYVSSQQIDPGTYKVSFINIVGENANSYVIKRPDEIIVQDGKSAIFEIQISLKPREADPDGMTQQEMFEGLMGADKESKVPFIPQETASENHIAQEKSIVEPVSTITPAPTHSKNLLNESAINKIIAFAAFLVVGLLLFLYKQLIYKHEYYDC